MIQQQGCHSFISFFVAQIMSKKPTPSAKQALENAQLPKAQKDQPDFSKHVMETGEKVSTRSRVFEG